MTREHYAVLVVRAEAPLRGDLARAGATPAFSFLAPNLCHHGHDAMSADGAPGGLARAGRFLAPWVPVIMAAPACQDGGLIVITFDEGSDPAARCGQSSGLGPSHPTVPLPGKTGPGGGRIGAVLLSPLIRPGTVSAEAGFTPTCGALAKAAAVLARPRPPGPAATPGSPSSC